MPRRKTDVAWSALAIAFSPPRRQHSLPQEADVFGPPRAILSKAGSQPAGGGTKSDGEGQQVEGFRVHVGFHDESHASQ